MSMLIQKDTEEHEADLMFSIHSDLDRISEEEPDIVMVCAGGKQVLTNRYILGLWSPLVRASCTEERNMLLLPDFTKSCTETVVRLLSPGWEQHMVTQQELKLMESLGIWGLGEEGEVTDLEMGEIKLDYNTVRELETKTDPGKTDPDVKKPEVKRGRPPKKGKTKTETKITFLDCDLCNLKFLDENSLNMHKKEHKKGLPKVKEEKFDEDEISENKIKKVSTKSNMTGRKPKITFLDCDHCNLKFIDERGLKMHVIAEHKKAKSKDGNSSGETLSEETTGENEAENTGDNLFNNEEVESKESLVGSVIQPKENSEAGNGETMKPKKKFVLIDCNQCHLKFLDEKGLNSHRIIAHNDKV